MSKTTYFASSVIEAYNDSLDRYYERIDDLEYNNNKYKSTLEEIREIEKLAYYSQGVPEEPLSQRDFILGAINEYEKRRIKILTKINEVLNENSLCITGA